MLLAALAAGSIAAAAPPPQGTERMPNVYSAPARCGPLHEAAVRRVQAAQHGRAPLLQYAVLRQMDGCAVPAPAGYHPDYLLPGRADAPRFRPASDAVEPLR